MNEILETRGWVRVPDISHRAALVELANSIGLPVSSPSGEVVRELRTDGGPAKPNTFSAIYGRSAFPLHTDTAFWPVPARYVVLRAYGDTRRCTVVQTFENLLNHCHKRASSLAAESLWLSQNDRSRFYCSMKGQVGTNVAWRYDHNCMSPVNRGALELRELLDARLSSCPTESIDWSGKEAAILANWRVLHGRGPAPCGEGPRILERIYVR